MLRSVALCLAVAIGLSGCGSGKPVDVKAYTVAFVDRTPMLMFTAVYRADVRSQTVLWSVEGVANSESTLENCTVRDALNWRCEKKDDGAVSGSAMVNGRYEPFGSVVPEGFKYLTESEWKALQQP